MRDLELDRFGLRWAHAWPCWPTLGRMRRRPCCRGIWTRRSPASTDAAPATGRRTARSSTTGAVLAMRSSKRSHAVPAGACRRKLAWSAWVDGLRELARIGLMPLQRFLEERFRAGRSRPAVRRMRAAHRRHTRATSAFIGWLLVCLGQEIGFPVPAGGAGELTRRWSLDSKHVEAACVVPRPSSVSLSATTAPLGVSTVDGTSFEARRRARRLRCRPPLHLRWSSASTCRRGCSTVSPASSGARPHSRWTGPCRHRFRGATRRSPRLEPCTSPTNLDELATTAHQLRIGSCRTDRSSSSAR